MACLALRASLASPDNGPMPDTDEWLNVESLDLEDLDTDEGDEEK